MTMITKFSKGILILLLLGLTVGCATTNRDTDGAHARAVKGETRVAPTGGGTGDGYPENPTGVPIRLSDLPEFEGSGMCDTIYFDYDRANIRSEFESCLNAIAAYMTAHPEYTLILEGHCDERGTDEYNLALGESRGESAMHYLMNRGLSPNRMIVRSWGEEKPVAMCSNESCWRQNRRVEFFALLQTR